MQEHPRKATAAFEGREIAFPSSTTQSSIPTLSDRLRGTLPYFNYIPRLKILAIFQARNIQYSACKFSQHFLCRLVSGPRLSQRSKFLSSGPGSTVYHPWQGINNKNVDSGLTYPWKQMDFWLSTLLTTSPRAAAASAETAPTDYKSRLRYYFQLRDCRTLLSRTRNLAIVVSQYEPIKSPLSLSDHKESPSSLNRVNHLPSSCTEAHGIGA